MHKRFLSPPDFLQRCGDFCTSYLVLACGLIVLSVCASVASGYEVHDADSRLYVALSQEMSQRPQATWCAPEWRGHWGREGLFVEHPPGLFWLGASLIYAGLPAFAALYTINQAAYLLGLWLLFDLTRAIANARAAWLAVGLWCASPAFIQYLVRGDQEHPLATSILLGLWALVSLRRPGAVGLVWALSCTLGCAFKGLPSLALVPLGIATLWLSRKPAVYWFAMAFGTLAATGVWTLFEVSYAAQTHTSFWSAYLTAQVAPSVGHSFVMQQKLTNLLYYAARPLWFAQPAVLVMAYATLKKRGKRREAERIGIRRNAGVWLGTGALALFVFAFSLADRKADRYLFAAYPLFALGAAVQLENLGGAASRLARGVLNRPRRARVIGTAALMVGIGLKMYLGTYHYVFIRWWPGA